MVEAWRRQRIGRDRGQVGWLRRRTVVKPGQEGRGDGSSDSADAIQRRRRITRSGFDVEYPERLSRWKIFVKWLLAIPHLIIVYLLQIVASVMVFIAFFAILFTKKWPRGMFDFIGPDPALDSERGRIRAAAAA